MLIYSGLKGSFKQPMRKHPAMKAGMQSKQNHVNDSCNNALLPIFLRLLHDNVKLSLIGTRGCLS